MTTLTAAARRQLQRVDDGDGFLLLVLMDHAALSGPVRIARDTRDHVIGGITFIGLPLEVQLPQDVAQEASRAQLRIDNVGRDLVGELESLPPGASLDVTLRVVSRAAPATVEWEFIDGASVAEADLPAVVLTLGDDSVMRRNAVGLRYDPSTAPGIFAG